MSAIEWIEGRSYDADRVFDYAANWLENFGWDARPPRMLPDYDAWAPRTDGREGMLFRIGDGHAPHRRAIIVDVVIESDYDQDEEGYRDHTQVLSVTITRLPR